MFDSIKRALTAYKSKPEEAVPLVREHAWSESSMYSNINQAKYNPDDLLTRKGYAIYSKMMLDEQVKAVVRFKRDAITSRDFVFDLDDDDLSEDEIALRKAVFKKATANIEASFTDALNGIMSAMYNGFSITEKVLGHFEHAGKTWVGINQLKLRPCDTFLFHTDEYGNVQKFVQQFDSREQTLDIEAFIHYVQNPDFDTHYGRSELRECYRAWFSKDMVIKFQNIHLERFAAGFVWAAPKDGKMLVAGTPEYTSLQNVMKNLQATSSIILPSGIELNIERPATTDAFERAISQHDKAIAKALLVPNLLGISEQGNTGSFAQSKTQLEAFLWTLDADATRLEQILNTQLFKQLGDINFGDGKYPRFKFKPISDERKLEIVKIWMTLVTAGAVQATDLDEAYIRDALEMPKKAVIEGDAPDLILNSAQVTALTGIVAQVGAGTLSPEAAKALITAVFPISEEQASAMVDTAKVEQSEPVVPAGGVPAKPIPPKDGIPIADTLPAKPADDGGGLPDETIVGKMGISVSAFSKAMKRVDFAVIANKADNSSKDAAYELAAINSGVVARLVALAEDLKLGTAEGNPADISKITFTPAEVSLLNKTAAKGLKEAWTIGESHAKKEMAKAKGAAFATNDLALQDVAASYIKAKGYTLAGDISGATQKVIRNILMEGVKVSKTQAETKTAIYKALESDGLLTEEAVIEALGASTVKQAASRIETAIRTTSFEAINEARYNMFSDPELGGFVEALEYSAILDDRTCFAAGTLVQSTKGMIPIESIKPNDEVISGSGKIRRVRARKTAISKDWREITFEDGTMVRATPTHPLWTLQRGGYRWMEVKTLKVGDRIGGKDLSALRETIYNTSIKAEEVLQPGLLSRKQECTMDYANVQNLQAGIHDQESLCSTGRDLLLSEVQGNKSQGRHTEEVHNIHMREMWQSIHSSPLGTQEQSSTLLEEVPEYSSNEAVYDMRNGVQVKGISGSDVLLGSVLSEIEKGNATGSYGAGDFGTHGIEFQSGSEAGTAVDRLCRPEYIGDRGGRNILAFEPEAKGCGCSQGHQNQEYGLASFEVSGDGSMRINEAEIYFGVDHSVDPIADKSIAIVEIKDFQEAPAFCYDIEIEGDHCYLLANGAIAHNTEICSQLNGETFGIDSEVWSTFRPPNHFNCRSLLIPVTVRDTWTEGDEPRVMPQKGFGFSRNTCKCGGD